MPKTPPYATVAKSGHSSGFSSGGTARALSLLRFVGAAFLLTQSAKAAIETIEVGSRTELARAANGTNYASFPKTLSFDVVDGSGKTQRKVLLSWSTTIDDGTVTPAFSRKLSADGGVNYGSTLTSPAVIFQNAIKLRNGKIVALPFKPNYGISPNRPDGTFSYYTSTDDGENWSTNTDGTLDWGTLTAVGMRFHSGVLEENDGTLYTLAYGRFTVDATDTRRTYLMKSVNEGQHWSFVATVGLDANEATLARCRDGSWLVVMRANSDNTLHYSRSTDLGVSWSTKATLPGLGAVDGVDPQLALLPNGVMVLSYGELDGPSAQGRDVRVIFSADGNGTAWSFHTETYTSNADVLGEESTGYTGIVPLGAHNLLQFSDTGTNWCYSDNTKPDYWNPATDDNPFSIWQHRIGIGRSETGRIDLKNHLAQSLISVSTDLTYTPSGHPEGRSAAAFDGSVDYWSGALRSASSGTFEIDLGRLYRISDLGIALHYNTSESADIYFSQDGVNWGVPVKTYANQAHRALDYTNLSVPITARYVAVDIASAGSLTSLGEIELYTTVDTFESDPYLSQPKGYSDGTLAWVTETSPYKSSRALVISDTSTTGLAKISKIVETTKSKSLIFWVNPSSISSAIAFDLLASSGTNPAYHVGIFPDGSIKSYNGSTWNVVGTATAGTVPVGTSTWTQIRVTAGLPPATGTLYVNGVAKGAVSSWATGVTGLNGFRFSSSSTAGTGDIAKFDDVEFTELNSSTDSFEADTVGASPAGYSGAVLATVSNSDAHGGSKSLRLNDNTAAQQAKISKTATDVAPYKALEFYAKMTLTYGFVTELTGVVGGSTAPVLGLKVYPSGQVNYYDGSAWVQLAAPGTVTNLGTAWHRFRIEANLDAANIYIDNRWLGAVPLYVSTATGIDGFSFKSSGTAHLGDEILIDDVYLGP